MKEDRIHKENNLDCFLKMYSNYENYFVSNKLKLLELKLRLLEATTCCCHPLSFLLSLVSMPLSRLLLPLFNCCVRRVVTPCNFWLWRGIILTQVGLNRSPTLILIQVQHRLTWFDPLGWSNLHFELGFEPTRFWAKLEWDLSWVGGP